jgi:predicted acyl esterase
MVLASMAGVAPASAGASTKLADVTIPASDGVNLVGDVYLPDGAGRHPAVIDMEPYGRSMSTDYVDKGYVRVNTDVRGSGKSGGALCLLCSREQQDVYDVVEWAASQPWSDGHVALYGYSYSAITSLLGAALEPPHLDAVVVGHPPTDPYRDVIWHNGLFDQGFVDQWFLGQTGTQAVGLGVQPQAADRAQQEFAAETRLAPLDGPLYEERSVLAKMSRITVPVYVFSGWEDMYSRGDLRLIDGLASRYKLLYIDASTHHGTGNAGEVGAPYAGAPQDQIQETTSLSATPPDHEDLAWLDRFVKGVPNGIEDKPRVRYFDLGDRTWHSSPSWQAATTRTDSLYLSAKKNGSATLSPNDGTLADQVPTGRDSYQDSYVYDPAAGATVPAGKDGPDGFLPYAPLDQTIDQPQGLTYTTPELKTGLPLAGPAELHFWSITEGSDMAYVARLIDVSPDGSTRLITQGWLRSSYRYVDPDRSRRGNPYLPDDRLLPVTLGLAIEYRMDIWDIAYTVAPGHRLRLWLSSSDTPTHEPLTVAGRNLIMHDSEHPSELLLGTRLPAAAGAPAAQGTNRRCRSGGRVQLRVPAARGGRRVVRAAVWVNGRRVLVRHGRRLKRVSFRRTSGKRLVVKVVATDNRGRRVVRRHVLRACSLH